MPRPASASSGGVLQGGGSSPTDTTKVWLEWRSMMVGKNWSLDRVASDKEAVRKVNKFQMATNYSGTYGNVRCVCSPHCCPALVCGYDLDLDSILMCFLTPDPSSSRFSKQIDRSLLFCQSTDSRQTSSWLAHRIYQVRVLQKISEEHSSAL